MKEGEKEHKAKQKGKKTIMVLPTLVTLLCVDQILLIFSFIVTKYASTSSLGRIHCTHRYFKKVFNITEVDNVEAECYSYMKLKKEKK